MKVSIFSDLHTETRQRMTPGMFKYVGANSDIVLLCGDIVNAKNYYDLAAIRAFIPAHVPVLFIPGNHEFYGAASVKKQRQDMRELCRRTGITYMDRNTFEFHGHLFIGATGWSDLKAYSDKEPLEDRVKNVHFNISDFHFHNDWSVERMIENAKQDKKFISKAITTAEQNKLIPFVMTHFPPLEYLNNEDFEYNGVSAYFVNQWLEVALRAKYWAFGHVHGRCRQELIGDTMFISNMQGYPRESETTFDPYMVIEI
jgi:predicted phosphohydrolase